MINIKAALGWTFVLISLFIVVRKGLKQYIKTLTKYISPIIILAFYLMEFSLTSVIERITMINLGQILTTPTIRVAVDSAIATLIFNFISFIMNSPATICVELNTRRNLKQLITYRKKPSYLNINISIDYRYKLLKKFIRYLGGIDVAIINTDWTSIQIDRAEEYGEKVNCDNPSEEILINCDGFLGSGLKSRIDLKLAVMSNVTVQREGSITTKIKYGQTKGIKPLILKFLIGIFINASFADFEVLNDELEE